MRVLTIFEVLVVAVFEADFPFRFPRAVVRAGSGSGKETGQAGEPGKPRQGSGDGGKPIAVGAAHETAFVGQGGKTLVEG